MNAQHTDRLIVENNKMNSYTEAKSELSLGSRSFLHRLNDRVRKMLDQSSKDATQDSNKHSLMWGMFMSSTLEASVFMGKEYSENLHSIKNTGDNLKMKPMCDISEKLLVGQAVDGSISPWSAMKKSSLSCTRRFTYLQILCYALERCARTHNQTLSGKTKLTWFKISLQNFGYN